MTFQTEKYENVNRFRLKRKKNEQCTMKLDNSNRNAYLNRYLCTKPDNHITNS